MVQENSSIPISGCTGLITRRKADPLVFPVKAESEQIMAEVVKSDSGTQISLVPYAFTNQKFYVLTQKAWRQNVWNR